jgi:hypothetical protein
MRELQPAEIMRFLPKHFSDRVTEFAMIRKIPARHAGNNLASHVALGRSLAKRCRYGRATRGT